MPSASIKEGEAEVATENKNVVEQTGVQDESAGEAKTSKVESDRTTAVTEAATLLAQGKRHLFVKDYPNAVATLGDACGKFGEIYGELAYECADAYFNYGCALLELAREESEVLDVDNKDKDSDDSEDGANETAGQEDKEAVQEDKADNESKADDSEGKDESQEKNEEKEGDGEEENEGEGDDDDDENVNNLQLAWEIFELAKRSFHQKNDESKLAETYLKLGEVAMESENYESAINDIKQCLDLQKKVVPPVIREVAETHFQLGVAYSLSNQFDEAIENFTLASKLLEDRIQVLSGMTDPEPENAKNPFYTVANEIAEIKDLLPEIKLKIIDTEDCKKETMNAVKETIGGSVRPVVSADGAGPSSNGSSSAAACSRPPANDISHLIRKKRKPDDETENESKKQK